MTTYIAIKWILGKTSATSKIQSEYMAVDNEHIPNVYTAL